MRPSGFIRAQRRPAGYVGRNHEILGSDFAAILKVLKLPEQVLGADEVAKLAAVRPTSFYAVAWMLELGDKLEAALGPIGLVRVGRATFELTHRARVVESAKSARDVLHGLDAMYQRANRGEAIGGWKVTRFEPGLAELEKNTLANCSVDQGLITAALSAVGCSCNVAHTRCFRQGAATCAFEISSAHHDARWSG